MGSSMKSCNNQNHNQRGNNNKPYALMVLLAFGAAILGVMVLHKLREKRMFTLLVKEKDHELLTLHLLFQREKEFNQEARKKIEEIKNKVYSLRTQKLELSRRQLEMESTISSLKDERKVIESALEEKKKEIQILTSRANSSTTNLPQVTALQSMIKIRDEKIEDLKSNLTKQYERIKLETCSTNVVTRQKKDIELLHSSDSTKDLTKGENISQNDGIFQRVNEYTSMVKPEKLNIAKDTELHLNKGNIENEDKEGTYFQGNQDDTIIEGNAKISSTSRDEEQHRLKMRRKHSKGKRKETLRNRKMGDEEQQKLEMHQNKKDNFENEEKLNLKDHSTLPDKGNPKVRPGDHNQSREEEVEKSREPQQMEPTEIKSNGNETEYGSYGYVKAQEATDGGRAKIDDVEENVRMQITNEINNPLKNQEANIKHEMLHNINATKHENNNDIEQGNASTSEESEVEDSEDAEIHEPEIDRDDIRLFSESDPDEEADETEF